MKFLVPVFLMIYAVGAHSADQSSLQQQLLDEVKRLSAQLESLRIELRQVKRVQRESVEENAAIKRQISELQEESTAPGQLFAEKTPQPQRPDIPLVDLSEQQITSVETGTDSHVLSNPWWQNIEIWGFAASGYYDTGSGGTRDTGSFEIKEASLFFEAQVWENTSFFLELQTNRLGADDAKFARTGEVYIHLRDVYQTDHSSVGVKVGRFDLPFGEEYLWQDAHDNPLITNSAAYPYGWDEGVLAYGNWRELNWIAAISDGSDARSSDDHSDKAVNLKLYGDPLENLYLSASYMANGTGEKSAIEFAGSHFEPVRDSTAGSSTSIEVESQMFELNAKYQFTVADKPAYLAVTAGWAQQSDDDSRFDRDFNWFSVEPYLQFSKSLYTVLRYSEIGTYDKDEGYHFDGKTFAGGNAAYGFDTERFRRLGVGLGWHLNPRVTAKLEIGRDWFDLVAGSDLDEDDSRNFVGLEMAVGF